MISSLLHHRLRLLENIDALLKISLCLSGTDKRCQAFYMQSALTFWTMHILTLWLVQNKYLLYWDFD